MEALREQGLAGEGLEEMGMNTKRAFTSFTFSGYEAGPGDLPRVRPRPTWWMPPAKRSLRC